MTWKRIAPCAVCALQIGAASPIRAHHFKARDPAFAATNSLETEGRAVDGRLADADADRRGCRARDHARAQRVPDHGSALGARLPDARSEEHTSELQSRQ